jgi:hypothetical protein
MTTVTEAKDFAIVMAYEALRICIHGTTQKHDPATVLRWMRLMLKQKRKDRADFQRNDQ